MTLREIIAIVQSRLGIDGKDIPESTIVSIINGVLTQWAEYFPDTFFKEAEGTAGTGSSALTLPADFRHFFLF